MNKTSEIAIMLQELVPEGIIEKMKGSKNPDVSSAGIALATMMLHYSAFLEVVDPTTVDLELIEVADAGVKFMTHCLGKGNLHDFTIN